MKRTVDQATETAKGLRLACLDGLPLGVGDNQRGMQNHNPKRNKTTAVGQKRSVAGGIQIIRTYVFICNQRREKRDDDSWRRERIQALANSDELVRDTSNTTQRLL